MSNNQYVVAWLASPEEVKFLGHEIGGNRIWTTSLARAIKYETELTAREVQVEQHSFSFVTSLAVAEKLNTAFNRDEDRELALLQSFVKSRENQVRERREQWFAEQVLEYHAGCESGKYEFLEEIGLERFARTRRSFRFDIDLEGPPSDIDNAASELEGVIDDQVSLGDTMEIVASCTNFTEVG